MIRSRNGGVMARRAEWFLHDADVWQCVLCRRGCRWKSGTESTGFCRVRGMGRDGPELPGYGRCVSLSVDPIEKKPLYHFLPRARILSTGPAGCNLSCDFCQNWSISQGKDVPARYLSPNELAAAALSDGSRGLAFTYTEPTIWYEYIMDTAPLIREKGGVSVMVSNGFIEKAPLKRLISVTDAWNVDRKSWSMEFYRKRCAGERDTVLNTIRELATSTCHLEVTFLVIPGENDDPKEWSQMAAWLAAETGRSTALHISRYFPRYRLKRPPTPLETLLQAKEVFGEHLDHVYLGNVAGASNDTLCPSCGNICVDRSLWPVSLSGLNGISCSACGEELGIIREL